MLYITYEDSVINAIGIWKKMQAQYHVLQRAFGEAYYTLYSGQMIHLFNGKKLIERELAITKKEYNEILINWIIKYKICRSYIRYDFADKYFLAFLQKQKEIGIKSILEFPTMPYDGEMKMPRPTEDKYYREQMYQYINCCTTYANYEKVFNIPCITLVNGVEIEGQKEKRYRKKDGEIILVAVATLARWHGYERVISGMHNYYKNGGKRIVRFHIVGEGGQATYYRSLVEEFHLYEYVNFYGELEGNELDAIYDTSDIAVGSLGFYKINLRSGSPIKLGEYCARGIPFIYGYDDISFSNPPYFAYQVPNDSTPVDIKKVIDFYDSIYDGRDFVKDMRQCALSKFTWDKILEPVIEYLS